MSNGKEHDESSSLCKSKNLYLIPGENVLRRSLLNNCFLTLTEYRLYFVYESTEVETYFDDSCHVSIPLNVILKVEQMEFKHLRILTKIGGSYILSFDSTDTCSSWLQTITEKIQPSSNLELFALDFFKGIKKQSLSTLRNSAQDKKLYKTNDYNLIQKEFLRMKFNKSWQISKVNVDFKICHSYPRYHIVPASITNDDIRTMAEFRGNKRFPSVVWRSQTNGAVLIRCAQPQVGLMCWRNSSDETFFKEVMKCLKVTKATEVKKLLIIDARHYSTAQFNRIRGGGVEYSEYYGNAEIMFMQLENIHSVRSSFDYISLVAANSDTWFTNFESSYWLKHLSKLLKSASDIARALDDASRSVIIHCSDGWDRTPQLTSLSQILLDKYYRSIEGFQVLIEKEWLQFGHKFADRCGFSKPIDHKERSPVFVQWLDCVHQLIHQYPRFFEFNETFLIKLAIHVHSGLFGNFLYNTEEERCKYDVYNSTQSIWNFLSDSNETMINPLYYRYSDVDHRHIYESAIYPKYNTKFIQPWNKLFFEALNPLDCHRIFSIDYSISKPLINQQSHTRDDFQEEEITNIPTSNQSFTLRRFKSETDLSSKFKRVSNLSDGTKFDVSMDIDVMRCDGRFINQASSTKTLNDGAVNGFFDEQNSTILKDEAAQRSEIGKDFQRSELVAYCNGISADLNGHDIPTNDSNSCSLHSSSGSNSTSIKVCDVNKSEYLHFRLMNSEDNEETYTTLSSSPCDYDGLFLSPEPVNQLAKQWNSKIINQALLIKQLNEQLHCEIKNTNKVRTVSTSSNERCRNEDSISSHESYIILESPEVTNNHSERSVSEAHYHCTMSPKLQLVNRSGYTFDSSEHCLYSNLRKSLCSQSTYQQCETASNASEKTQA